MWPWVKQVTKDSSERCRDNFRVTLRCVEINIKTKSARENPALHSK